MVIKKNNDYMWNFPWKFRESFAIAFGLVIIGFALEIVTPTIFQKPLEYPANIMVGIGFVVVLIMVHFVFSKNSFVKWLSSVPAAISAISVLALLTLLLGFIPQDNSFSTLFKKIGLTHLLQSWPFLFIIIYFEVVLALTILRRLRKPQLRDLSFGLNHLGLWIIVFAVAFGRGDLKRWNMYINEGETVWYAYDSEDKKYELDFAFKLKDFKIEQYNPKVAIFSSDDYSIPKKYKEELFEAEERRSQFIGDWNIKVDTVYDYAISHKDRYFKNKTDGSAFAAYIEARNKKKGKIIEGWISPGSYRMKPAALKLNKQYMVSLTQPEPRRYSSELVLYTKEGVKKPVILEVNKPFKIKGWKVYQQGYNERKGRWSGLTILEIVKDPWLPVVYTGIFMLMAGAVMLFWSGRRKQKHEPKKS
jgi:hypothetical protein